MCGRFVQTCTSEDLLDLLAGMEIDLSELDPDYNVGPGKDIVTITGSPTRPQCMQTRWGIPMTDASALNINARSETVAQKPLFRDLFSHSRCVIPADGFYEWQRQGKIRQPWYFSRKDEQSMFFAGLWTRHEGTCCSTIITTSANDLVGSIHDRMPVILRTEDVAEWLMSDLSERYSNLLSAFSESMMQSWTVSTRVNSVGNQGVENIQPVAVEVVQQLDLF